MTNNVDVFLAASGNADGLVQGDSYIDCWMLSDGSGNSINLTGCTAYFGILQPDGTSLIQCASDDGTGYLTISSAIGGVISLNIPGSVTDNWDTTWNVSAYYSTALKVKYTDGSERTESQQTLSITPQVANG